MKKIEFFGARHICGFVFLWISRRTLGIRIFKQIWQLDSLVARAISKILTALIINRRLRPSSKVELKKKKLLMDKNLVFHRPLRSKSKGSLKNDYIYFLRLRSIFL